jgi:hypothetical protein
MISGNDVVGAATIEPLGAYGNAWSTLPLW